MKTVIHINTAITSCVQLTKEKKMCDSKKKKNNPQQNEFKMHLCGKVGIKT